jgi:hypothetical protein
VTLREPVLHVERDQLRQELARSLEALLAASPRLASATIEPLVIERGQVWLGAQSGERAQVVGLDARIELGFTGVSPRQRVTVAIEHLGGLLRGRGGARSIAAEGTVSWRASPPALYIHRFHASVGQSRVALDGHVDQEGSDLALRELYLHPAELGLLLPTEAQPSGPLLVRGTARGRIDSIVLAARASLGSGDAQLAGQIDLRDRRGHVRATLTNFPSLFAPGGARMHLRGTVEVSAYAATSAAGQVDATGRLSYERSQIDPNLLGGRPAASPGLAGRFAARERGGRVAFAASGRVRGRRVVGTYKASIADPGRAARVAGSVPSVPPLQLSGRFDETLGRSGRLVAKARRGAVR